jgi:ATP-dependent DNA helicase RecG
VLYENLASDGESHVVSGRVVKFQVRPTRRRNIHIASFEIDDSTGIAKAIVFGGPRSFSGIREGAMAILYGAPRLNQGIPEFENPDWAILKDRTVPPEWSRMLPIYPTVKALPRKLLAGIIYDCVTSPGLALKDPLPQEILKKHSFPSLLDAIRGTHAPGSSEEIEVSRKRLAYQELYEIQKKAREAARRRKARRARPLGAVLAISEFAKNLPFELTHSQQSAISEISEDMNKSAPMHRLLQGDVGTGKTAVAAAVIAQCVKSGCQAAVLTPTTILSSQFYASCVRYLSPLGIRCEEFTAVDAKARKASFLSLLASGEIDVAIGTHALLGDDVEFNALGLVVIDEQHRFGVLQRERIGSKPFSNTGNAVVEGTKDARVPHTLMMSATPIPRTLMLALYGDVDVTEIRASAKPLSACGKTGRLPVVTKIVSDNHIGDVCAFLSAKAKAGERCFWVCRKVGGEEGEDDGKHENDEATDDSSVRSRAMWLSREIPFAHVGQLYGKMSQEEKNAAIADFRTGRTQILVSTTVIEVGVDVPDASAIVIEGASGYGLSQLHQMRGRVGRGGGGGVCILFDSVRNIKKNERLNILKNCGDGFQIAEEDMKLRGAGELDGLRQHGETLLKAARLPRDAGLLELARADLDGGLQ